jgi:O-antigen/teichoic acid export membrane protein
MRIFSLNEVGVISFIQSIILFISFSQIGLLNGGYRQVSKSDSHISRINDFIFSYNFYLLSGALISVFFIYFILDFRLNLLILSYSILAGFISVISNWINNLLIANQRINLLNKANLISLVFSFLCLLLVNISSLWSGILFVTSQSFILVFISLYLGSYKIRITALKKRTFKYIFFAGFTPYLINIIGSFFLLFEKWMIAADLGVRDLGTYYMVGVYSVFFQLVPGALNNIEFSAALRSFNKHDNTFETFNILNSYFLKLTAYIILVGFITYFLAETIVAYFLPQYISSIHLIKIVFWGLALITIVQPIALVFQIKLKYRAIVSIYLVAIFLALFAYYLFTFNEESNLETYAFINLFFNALVAILFCFLFFWKSKKK